MTQYIHVSIEAGDDSVEIEFEEKEVVSPIKIFIQKANLKHASKYDYSETVCNGSRKCIKIICPKHGTFQQRASDHLQGRGCRHCNKEDRDTNSIEEYLRKRETFIAKAGRRHGTRYDYTPVIYYGSQVNIRIRCPMHGTFIKTPNNHLRGQGCPECRLEQIQQR